MWINISSFLGPHFFFGTCLAWTNGSNFGILYLTHTRIVGWKWRLNFLLLEGSSQLQTGVYPYEKKTKTYLNRETWPSTYEVYCQCSNLFDQLLAEFQPFFAAPRSMATGREGGSLPGGHLEAGLGIPRCLLVFINPMNHRYIITINITKHP